MDARLTHKVHRHLDFLSSSKQRPRNQFGEHVFKQVSPCAQPLAEVNTFFEQHKPRLGHKIIEQHLEHLAVAIEFCKCEGAKLEAALKV